MTVPMNYSSMQKRLILQSLQDSQEGPQWGESAHDLMQLQHLTDYNIGVVFCNCLTGLQ